jgi:putative ABC transport system permease protein
MANNVRLVLADTDAASLERVKVSLDRNLEREGVRALSSLSNADSRYGFDQHMVMIYVALIIMSFVIGGVAGLGLMTTMSLNVLERRREMGILRAIGASPRAVWLIVVAESAVIGMLSWGLAGLAAWPLSKGLGNHLAVAAFGGGLDFAFELRGLLIWLAVSIVLAALSSFLPAWRASRSAVREALAYE